MVGVLVEGLCLASTWPRLSDRGKLTEVARFFSVPVQLQWGRDPRTVENTELLLEHPFGLMASMGPRRFGCGKLPSRRRMGRWWCRFNGAAVQGPWKSDPPWPTAKDTFKLQRGRGPKTAENGGVHISLWEAPFPLLPRAVARRISLPTLGPVSETPQARPGNRLRGRERVSHRGMDQIQVAKELTRPQAGRRISAPRRSLQL